MDDLDDAAILRELQRRVDWSLDEFDRRLARVESRLYGATANRDERRPAEPRRKRAKRVGREA